MIIKQINDTPIGNHFHDTGTTKIFNEISSMVDEFEVDSEQLLLYCDDMIDKMKSLKSVIKKEEQQETKRLHDQKTADMRNSD